MKEEKKLIIIMVMVVVLLMLIPFTGYIKKVKGERILTAIKQFYKESSYNLIYLSSSDCSYSNQFDPVIEKVATEYNFNYAYVDVLNLTNAQNDELLKKLKIDQDDFGTPYLIISKDGKKVAEQLGYLENEELIEFLKENDFLDEDAEPIETNDLSSDLSSDLNYINATKFVELINSSEKQVIVLGQTSCGACSRVIPILEEIIQQEEIEISYINVDQIESDEEYQKYSKEISNLGLTTYYTPHIMVVQKGIELGNIVGVTTKEDYIELFKEHGVIE